MKTKCTRCRRSKDQVVYSLTGGMVCHSCMDDIIREEKARELNNSIEFLIIDEDEGY